MDNQLKQKIENLSGVKILQWTPLAEHWDTAWVSAEPFKEAIQKINNQIPAAWVENLAAAQVENTLILSVFFREAEDAGGVVLRVSLELKEGRMDAPSLSRYWPSARPFEEEIEVLWGVRFEKSQDHRQFRPGGFEGYPLRKTWKQ